MSTAERALPRRARPDLWLGGAFGAGLAGITALGLFADRPWLALLACLALAVGLVALAWPNLTTMVVLFMIYSNAAVVAVRFHDVPFVVGAAVPLALLVPLAYYVLLQRERLMVDQTFRLMLVLLAIHLVASLFSRDTGRSLGVTATFLVEGLGLYFLVVNVVRTPETLRRAVWVLLAAGACMGGLSCLQQITKTYDNKYGGFAQIEEEHAGFATGEMDQAVEARQRRLAGPLGQQNRYAQVMLMLVPLGLFCCWQDRSVLRRGLALAATGVSAMGLALAFSRGAALGFLMMLGVMVALRYVTVRQTGLVVLGLALLLVAVPQYTARMASLLPLVGTIQDDGPGIAAADSSLRSRLGEALAAVLMFADHPLTGVGPGMYSQHYQAYAARAGTELVGDIKVKEENREPHVLYLGLAAELGLPGLAAFLAIVALMLVNLERARRRCLATRPDMAKIVTGFLLAIVAYLGTAFFLHFAYIRYFWLMMALAAAATHIATRLAAPPGGALPSAAIGAAPTPATT